MSRVSFETMARLVELRNHYDNYYWDWAFEDYHSDNHDEDFENEE